MTTTFTTTVTKTTPNTTGQYGALIATGDPDNAQVPDLDVTDYLIVTPGGTQTILARNLAEARGWVRRNLLRPLRDTAEVSWWTARVRGTRCSIALVHPLDGADDWEVRVMSGTAPITRPGSSRVRHDVCTCTPRFSGHCAACQTHGVGTFDRAQLMRNPEFKRSAVGARPSVKRDGFHRAVVVLDQLTAEGRRTFTTLMCGHDHGEARTADQCAARAAKTEKLDGFAPGVASRTTRTLRPCAACDGATTTTNSHRYTDGADVMRVHHDCAVQLGLDRAERGARFTK